MLPTVWNVTQDPLILDPQDCKLHKMTTCLKAWLQAELILSQGTAAALEVRTEAKFPSSCVIVKQQSH